MKFLKKLLIVGAVVGAVAFVAKGTKIAGHARNEVASLVEWAESNIPPEKEIARLRKDVSALDKDIKNVGAALAKETVEVKYLKEDAGKLRTQVSADEQKILARGQVLKEATEVKSNNGRTISVSVAMDQLRADVQRLKSKEKALDAMETSIVAREKVKEALERQLDELKKKKIELAADIDTIEAEFNMLKYKQMESKYSFDDSRLSKIKQSIQDLRKRHDIAVETMKIEPLVREDLPSTEGQTVDDILAPLTGGKTEKSGEKISQK
jgi:chromosome segregation ATPase